MKTLKQLKALWDNAEDPENIKQYSSFEMFKANAKEFVKDCKDRNTACGMKVSASGMTRHFNFTKAHNSILNVCYNGVYSHKPVKVEGCGMDMHWCLKFRACEELCTDKEIDKWNLNSACSSGWVL